MRFVREREGDIGEQSRKSSRTIERLDEEVHGDERREHIVLRIDHHGKEEARIALVDEFLLLEVQKVSKARRVSRRHNACNLIDELQTLRVRRWLIPLRCSEL